MAVMVLGVAALPVRLALGRRTLQRAEAANLWGRGGMKGMEEEQTFATPEAAALATFDPRYARVVRVTFKSPDVAMVELATNEEPYLYPYFVYCRLTTNGWVEEDSHN